MTLAIALLQHDVPFTLYESAAKFGEIGAGVGFGPNAVTAMGLISPQMKEAYHRCRTLQCEKKQNVWFTTRVGDRRKAGDDGETFTYGGRPGWRIGDELFEIFYPNLDAIGRVGGVHRAHYLDQLVKLIPSSVSRFGKRLVNLTRATESEDVVLHFADGTTAQHTAVLGCDGIKSQTRKLLLGDDKFNAVFSGKCAYRGLVPMKKAVEFLGEEKAQNTQIYFGYHGHILTFPIEMGKTMNGMFYFSSFGCLLLTVGDSRGFRLPGFMDGKRLGRPSVQGRVAGRFPNMGSDGHFHRVGNGATRRLGVVQPPAGADVLRNATADLSSRRRRTRHDPAPRCRSRNVYRRLLHPCELDRGSEFCRGLGQGVQGV